MLAHTPKKQQQVFKKFNKQKKEKNAEHSTYPISEPTLKIRSAPVHPGIWFSLLLLKVLVYGLFRRPYIKQTLRLWNTRPNLIYKRFPSNFVKH